MSGNEFIIEVNPSMPERLGRLPELANDLWYSWHRPTRSLFSQLNPHLWKRTGHNPKLFLRSVDQKNLEKAADDQVFLAAYNQVLSAHDTYHGKSARCTSQPDFKDDDLVAYFCAEYGFHESFPIYSGGLGILAGDHCKTASDMHLPFVGVGLLYRQGYFSQYIDNEGIQIALNHDSNLEDLPVSPARGKDGKDVYVTVAMPGREVLVKVWRAVVGHVRLYLLDTNLEENSPEDREITHKLYGGDLDMRLRQEIVLGIGGVRVLERLRLKPTVWHINEGHAAFMVLERNRQLRSEGLDFSAALELVAAKTVFTTHTPVPAGHDQFSPDLILEYFSPYIQELGLSKEEFLELGRLPNLGEDFNMTTLAIRGSRHHNGVSRIHGDVSARVCADCWPQVSPEENPISYITNGVHVPSVLAQAWSDLFDRFLGAAWRNHLMDKGFWERIDEIPDHLFWSVSQSIKSQMCYALRNCLTLQHLRNQVSEAHLERMLKHLDPGNPNVLTIGFARRFATYKRATLLDNDRRWLWEILHQAERPVVFVFAGKAHPADKPGQELLKQIHELSSMSEFVGRILLVEGYDMALARRLVSGVDVWLNNPVYPLEASGTSGMKAAINGSINLSVLDGWWAEGYDGDNGWGIKPSPHSNDETRRDYEDARTLYEILQDDVVPLYYDQGKHGYSPGWVRKCKHSMATVLPRFNTCRMLSEYGRQLYLPAAKRGRKLRKGNFSGAKELAAWKDRIRNLWPGVSLRRLNDGPQRIGYGDNFTLEMAVNLNGLNGDDVAVELLLSRPGAHESSFIALDVIDGEGAVGKKARENDEMTVAERFQPAGPLGDSGEYRFTLQLKPDWCGRLTYKVRAFPYHKNLTHMHEMGLMVWL